MMACKTTVLKAPASRRRASKWARYDKGLKRARLLYEPLNTYIEACKPHKNRQLSLPFEQLPLDVTVRTDTFWC